jgi:hypothetical protein
MKRRKEREKRGAVEEWLEQIPYIFLTIAVMVAMVFLINYFINLKIDSAPTQANVFFYRVMYAPNSIMLMDNETGRVRPGVIDLSLFTNQTLDNSIKYSYEKQISAKLELSDRSQNPVATAYYNGLWFNRLSVMAEAGLAGGGSARTFTRTVPVVYVNGGIVLQGFLKMQVVIPR